MRFKRIGTTLASAAAVTVLSASPALAYPSTPFAVSSGLGAHSASGNLTWFNRSVQVQGKVTDVGGAGTRVHFSAYTPTSWVGSQARPTGGLPAVNESVSYNFTFDGSAYSGGITEIAVWIYNAHSQTWSGPTSYYRP
ncbi:hypothetical protein [Streptomyces narbonensis]|uniref:hypothetical protein n=1 Tax=Streptomyces narbonensis TaxID=67333 RepID=UPI00340EA905